MSYQTIKSTVSTKPRSLGGCNGIWVHESTCFYNESWVEFALAYSTNVFHVSMWINNKIKEGYIVIDWDDGTWREVWPRTILDILREKEGNIPI